MRTTWVLAVFWPFMLIWFAYDGWLNPAMAEHQTFNRVGTAILVPPSLIAVWHWIRNRDSAVVSPHAAEAIPEELLRHLDSWNWGALLFTPVWSIGHRIWWGVLAAVPYVGFPLSIYLALRGSRHAWQSLTWDSEEEFAAVQRVWARWVFCSCGVLMVLVALALVGEIAA